MDQQNEFDKEIYDEKKCTGSFPRPSSPLDLKREVTWTF